MNRKKIVGQIAGALRYIILIVIIIISLLPLLWTLNSSLKTDTEIFMSAFSLPKTPLFQNYVKVFTRTPMLIFYINSIIIAAVTTFSSMLIYGMSAYLLSRFKFKGRDTIFIILSLSLLVPATSIFLPVYILWLKIGLYNTRFGLIIVYLALSMPVSLMVLRSYFRSIPREIEEAAYMDGSPFMHTYFLIVCPIARPAFASAAVFSFILAWNDFLYAYMLTRSNSVRTLPVSIRYFMSMYGSDYNLLFAASIIIIIPTIILYLLMQKTITQGLLAGALKG